MWHTILLAFLGIVAGSPAYHQQVPEFYGHGEPIKPYRGPPAPLNPDGTVAYTPEFHELATIHHQMHAEEYKRLQQADAFAKANPDLTSPPGKGDVGSYSPVAPQYHQGRRYRRAAATDDGYLSQGVKYIEPAPLNQDGTVAHTPEYAAMAAHIQAAHHSNFVQQLEILKRQEEIARAAGPDKENYDSPAPYYSQAQPQHAPQPIAPVYRQPVAPVYSQPAAPVYSKPASPVYSQPAAPVYRQPIATTGPFSHHQQFQAASQGSRFPAPIYEHSDSGLGHKYSAPVANSLSSYSGKQFQSPPAPLNKDGTVAYTPEYLSIASAHAGGRYRRAAQHYKPENRYNGPPAPLHPDGRVAYTPEYKHISGYNAEAAAGERAALVTGYAKAAESYHEALQRHRDAAQAHTNAHVRQLETLAKQEELARAAGPDHLEETAHQTYPTQHQTYPTQYQANH